MEGKSAITKYMFDYDNETIETDSLKFKEVLQWEQLVKTDELWNNLINLLGNKEQVVEYFNKLDEDSSKTHFEFAVACLINFVQANFTGPDLSDELLEYFKGEKFSCPEFVQYLSSDNEELNSYNDDINCNARFLCLLAVARLVFKHCKFEEIVRMWWNLRCLLVHQKVLDELSTKLWEEAKKIEADVDHLQLKDFEKARFQIELAQLHLSFRNITKAQHRITTSGDILGLQYRVTGKMGRRTRYQQRALPQLDLQAIFSEKEDLKRPPVKEELCIPQSLTLNDDTRLDSINFVDKDEDQCQLPNLEQQHLLTTGQERMISTPSDELHLEEVQPIITTLLRLNNTWTVRLAGLLLRCRLDAKDGRTVERCLSQIEEILHCYKKSEPHPLARIGGVYASGLQPIWRTQVQYADLMFKLGLVKAALDEYLKLEMWEEVIGCYTTLNLKHKAAEIIKQQLDVKPSVRLMCWLGDATDDVTCYEKAWEMSKETSARAQRHWGAYYYYRKQYKECIPHYTKSVNLNLLQPNVWLRLAYAALDTEDWQVAITAYQYYTNLEPGNFEAWNNLAQAHIKLGNKRSAHQVLLNALGCNYDNWKIWENLLMVSAAISHLSDVIRSYHRLLDLKEKYLNIEILSVLVYGISNNVNDPEGRPCGPLIPKCRELFGRIVAIYPGDGTVWELYASLAPDRATRAQRLQRAYRGYVKTNNWNKEVDGCLRVLHVCLKLAEVVLEEEIPAKDPILPSVRLNLSSALTAIRKQNFQEVAEPLQDVGALYEKVSEKVLMAAAS